VKDLGKADSVQPREGNQTLRRDRPSLDGDDRVGTDVLQGREPHESGRRSKACGSRCGRKTLYGSESP